MNDREPEFKSVLDVLPDPVLLLRGGRISYCNEAAAELVSGLAVGQPCPLPLSAALPEGEDSGMAVCNIGGKSCTVATTATAEGTALVVRVIHEAGRRGRAWMPAFTEQMREQMTTLLAAAQQMEGDRQEDGEAQSNKWMAVLNQSAYRLLRMVSAVELEQAMADGQAFHPTTIDLAGLCHSLEMEVAPLAKQIGLTFSYDSADLSLLTTADAGLLRSMLLGLISNAMKAVGQGGRLGLRLTRRGERAVITIWDDGPGMDERSLGSLFRSDSGGAIPRPKEGLRLGLLNARSIAALHDGVLVVESKQGHGARFTVSLPIKPPEGLQLRTPRQTYDRHSGFSSLLVELSDALPWQVFLPDELE